MNRKEFLRKLQLELYKLPRQEIDDAIAYYNEYFEEAGPEREQDVVAELGSPSKIATQIKADYAVRQLESIDARSRQDWQGSGQSGTNPGPDPYAATGASGGTQKKPGKISTVWWVVIGVVGGIFAAPIAIPLAIALAIMAICVIGLVLGLFLAALVGTIALVAASIALVVAGLSLLATSVPLAILVIGLGLMGASVMALLVVGIVSLMNMFIRFLARRHRENRMKNQGVMPKHGEIPAEKAGE